MGLASSREVLPTEIGPALQDILQTTSSATADAEDEKRPLNVCETAIEGRTEWKPTCDRSERRRRRTVARLRRLIEEQRMDNGAFGCGAFLSSLLTIAGGLAALFLLIAFAAQLGGLYLGTKPEFGAAGTFGWSVDSGVVDAVAKIGSVVDKITDGATSVASDVTEVGKDVATGGQNAVNTLTNVFKKPFVRRDDFLPIPTATAQPTLAVRAQVDSPKPTAPPEVPTPPTPPARIAAPTELEVPEAEVFENPYQMLMKRFDLGDTAAKLDDLSGDHKQQFNMSWRTYSSDSAPFSVAGEPVHLVLVATYWAFTAVTVITFILLLRLLVRFATGSISPMCDGWLLLLHFITGLISAAIFAITTLLWNKAMPALSFGEKKFIILTLKSDVTTTTEMLIKLQSLALACIWISLGFAAFQNAVDLFRIIFAALKMLAWPFIKIYQMIAGGRRAMAKPDANNSFDNSDSVGILARAASFATGGRGQDNEKSYTEKS